MEGRKDQVPLTTSRYSRGI